MMKRLLLAASLLALGTAAHATEVNPDPGCDSAGSWMADPGASVSGSKCVFSNVAAMKGLMITAPLVKEGHRYRGTATVSSYSQGVARVVIGLDMMTAATYTPLPAVDLNGLAPINDALATTIGYGVTSGAPAVPDSMGADIMGAFRMECFSAARGVIDPEVYPNQKGRSHIHSFVDATFITPNATYASLRNHGGSTCGSGGAHSVNKSLYWQPAMLDGAGHVIVSWYHELYYKRQPLSSSFCTPGNADFVGGTGGSCIGLPNGIRFIFGYNFATGLGGPLDAPQPGGGPAIIKYGCSSPTEVGIDLDPGTPGNQSTTIHLSDFYGGVCPIGYQVNVAATAPNCWDGVNLDSSNHRTHLVNPSVLKTDHLGGLFFACDDAHPYAIPDFQWSEFYISDANLVAGKWHLSSDEMVHGALPGSTMHVDYFEGWDPAAKLEWLTYCIDQHSSCSAGKLGNGHIIKGDVGKPIPPTSNVYESMRQFGQGPDMRANGTYTFEFTAPSSGRLGIIGVDDASGNGFTGSVDSVSITEITTGRKGPATVTVH
jgi:hypothetical protein